MKKILSNNTSGKSWRWQHRKCECGTCTICRNRESSRRSYHRKRGNAEEIAPEPPMKQYEWDRT